MNTAYHQTATPNVAFNPFLPAIGRVYQVLCDSAPIGAIIETNNRELADAAGLSSAGHLPRLLRDLEALGYIERVTSGRGSLITVTPRSPMRDHAFTASGCDPESDQPSAQPAADPMWDQPNPIETRDRSSVRIGGRSRMADPPLHPPGWNHDSYAAAESAAAHESLPSGGCGGVADPRWDRSPIAAQLVELGCDDPGLVEEILAVKPELTLERLDAQWQIAKACELSGYTSNARRLLFGTLRKPGGWLHGRATDPAQPIDWSSYAQPERDPADAAYFSAYHQALAILPRPYTQAQITTVVMALVEGASESAALALLREAS